MLQRGKGVGERFFLESESSFFLFDILKLASSCFSRLLQEFVEKHGNGLEVVYSLSGWLKNTPSTYHIRIVSSPILAGFVSFHI